VLRVDQFFGAETRVEQSLASLRLGASRPHRADERGRGTQGDHERGVIELGVVHELDDRRRRVDCTELFERLRWPEQKHILCILEPAARRESGSGVDHKRPPADRLRQRAERRGDIDRADDQQTRRRRNDIDE
jgi:hypothetical protein